VQKLIVTLFFLLPLSFLYSQGNYFYQVIGTIHNDQCLYMDNTLDGGFILGGYIENTDTGRDFLIIKTDGSGQVIWRKIFGSTGDDWIQEIKTTSDGGYIIAARSDGIGVASYDGIIIKINSLGNIQWSKSLGGGESDQFWSVMEDSNGKFLVSGFNGSFSVGNNDSYLARFLANGDFEWQSTIGNVWNEYTSSIIETSDGGYVMTGFVDISSGINFDVMLLKVDNNGNLDWCRNYGGFSYDRGWAVRQTQDDGFLIAGQTLSFGNGNGDAFLLKTNSSGELTWAKTLGFSGEDAFYDIGVTANGTFILGGKIFIQGYSDQVLIAEIDENGNLLWAKDYGLYGNERARSVVAFNEGITAAGWTTSNSFGGDDIFILKTDLEGNVCNLSQNSISINLNPAQINSGNYSQFIGTTGLFLDTPNFINYNNNFADLDFCNIIPVELTSFNAITAGGNVELNWATATETNNQMFEIERKTDKGQFVTIGYVKGHGTTAEAQNYAYTDRNVPVGSYCYKLKQLDYDGTFVYSNVIEVEVTSTVEFSLFQNFPNPFNPTTVIKYQIPELSFVTLKIYDVLGSEILTVVHEEKPAGRYKIEFDATTLPSGVYFYKLQASDFVETRKMVLMK